MSWPDDATVALPDPGESRGPLEQALEVPGRYRLSDLLGRGGMGSVFLAADDELAREVAVKVLHCADDATASAKFEREARVTAQLAHPGIVPVYHLGLTPDGRRFYVMRRVAGEDLSERLARLQAIGPRERLELLQIFLKVCQAVAYAHDNGVIHRDLKPANVMVGDYGEVLVVDWGLARTLSAPELAPSLTLAPRGADDELRTLDGMVMGTPAYMPPEQASGKIDQIDERSDVYALGAMLYELLTLRPPYRGGAYAVLEAVIAGPPPPPSEVADWEVPWELEAVVTRAMEPRRGRRYASVQALMADVSRYLEGGQVAAASYSATELLRRWLWRQRVVVGAALLLVAGLLTAALISYRNIGAALDQEQRARRAADTALQQAQLATAKEEAQRRKADRLRELERAQGERLRGELRRALWGAARTAISEQRTLDGAAFLAAAGGASNPETRALELSSPPPVAWPRERFEAQLVRVLDDGRLLVWCRDQTIKVREADGTMTTRFDPVYRLPLAASADGHQLAVLKGAVLELRYSDGRRLRLKEGQRHNSAHQTRAVVFHGAALYALSHDGTLTAWRAASGERIWWTQVNVRPARALAVRDGELVVAASLESRRTRLLRFKLPGVKPRTSLDLPLVEVSRLRWGAEGRLYAGARSGLIAVVAGERVERLLTGHDAAIVGLREHGGGLISASRDGRLRWWDVERGRCVQTADDHGAELRSIDTSSGELFSGDIHGSMRWQLAPTIELTPGLKHGVGVVDAVALGGDLLATSGNDGCVQLWSAERGQPLRWWLAHAGAIRPLVDPAGQWLVTTGTDGYVKRWGRGGERRWDHACSAGVIQAAISPDRRWLAVYTQDGWLRSLSLESGELLARRNLGPSGCGVGFVGETLVTGAGCFDGAELSQRPQPRLPLPERPLRDRGPAGLAVSPDGNTVALSRGSRVELYRWPRAERVGTIRLGHPVNAMAWVTEGVLAVASLGVGSVRLHGPSGAPLGRPLPLATPPRSLAAAGGSLYVGGLYGELSRFGRRPGATWRAALSPLADGQPARLGFGQRQAAVSLGRRWGAVGLPDSERFNLAINRLRIGSEEALALLSEIESPTAAVQACALMWRGTLLAAGKRQFVSAAAWHAKAARMTDEASIRQEAMLHTADLLLAGQRYDEAIAAYRALAAVAPPNLARRVRISEAYTLARKGQQAEASRLLREAIEARQPGDGPLGCQRCSSPLDPAMANFLTATLPDHPLALLEAASIFGFRKAGDRVGHLLSLAAKAVATPAGARWKARYEIFLAEH